MSILTILVLDKLFTVFTKEMVAQESERLIYKGKPRQSQDSKTGDGAPGQISYPYIPSEELIDAVNLAIYLKRPLLLKGEPGCGKTTLASAVAEEFGLLRYHYYSWYIKSTTRAQDGLYTFDAITQLRDAQLANSGRITQQAELNRIDNPETYVRYGPLGQAFRSEKRAVVLIDEIDKADIDFPNDLLRELEESKFVIDEVRVKKEGKEELEPKEIRANQTPIIFITTNDEKELPNAFLRRCLFYHIEFPDDEQLKKILKARFPQLKRIDRKLEEELVGKAVKRFSDLRKRIKERKIPKRVSTSELIDWFDVLLNFPNVKEVKENVRKLDGKLPYACVLLKHLEDQPDHLLNP